STWSAFAPKPRPAPTATPGLSVIVSASAANSSSTFERSGIGIARSASASGGHHAGRAAIMSRMPNSSVELYLVRHAHAGDPARWTGPDERRPLSAKGRLQAERLGRHLAAIRLELEAIVSSRKVRARETADLVASALGIGF